MFCFRTASLGGSWLNEPTTTQRCSSEKETFILEDLFSSVLLQCKKYHPSGNLKFNNLVIFQSIKLRVLVEKILPISLNPNFTPNTLGSYGLRWSTTRSRDFHLRIFLCNKEFCSWCFRSIPFVLLTSSLAFFLLCGCYLLVDVWGCWTGSPFIYPGRHLRQLPRMS